MKLSLWVGLTVLGMATISVGCSNSRPVMRGQSPGPGVRPSSYQMPGPTPGPMYYDGPSGYGPSSCPPQNCPPQHCHPNGAECPICAPDNFWMPTHHHTYDYKQPPNLVYPPQNQPAGVVVYPYYTCKGPSDFFMK